MDGVGVGDTDELELGVGDADELELGVEEVSFNGNKG